MPQKTNLNISPYYDDFDKAKNFYKVLFRPGHPVQARELTGLQSILQNQVESFGKHIFKEGSMVIPGGIEYDPAYFAVKVNATHLGIDVSVYLNNIIANNNGKGTRVRGQNSGIVATIKNFILPPSEGVDDITIFVKYIQSGDNGESVAFPNGEVLILEENLTYGNTTLNTEETILTLVPEDATAVGSAFGISKGVYFMRGIFVDVETQLIVLDPYSNSPSYRIGLEIIEEIVNANDDSSLYDNAKGFTNFAAPGADRFKITTKLAKKSLQDENDTNFVELFRIRDGQTKRLQDTTVYSEIKKYFAKRTFDESGNYAVEPFRVNIQNSLNDEVSSRGLYTSNQLTDQGNTPSNDLMCVKLSPGKAYVRGFDVYLPGTTVVDVEKPRDTKSVLSSSVPFKMGSLLKVNRTFGTPLIKIGGNTSNTIDLYNGRSPAETGVAPNNSIPKTGRGLKIGQARVYSFGVSDAPYENDATEFDLHLYDIQTFIILKVTATNNAVKGTRVRGLVSGAVAFCAEAANEPAAGHLTLGETTGEFIEGEEIVFDEQLHTERASITEVNVFGIDDIKSVFQDKTTTNSGLAKDFSADAVLYDRILPNFSINDVLSLTYTDSETSSATVAGRRFSGKVGIKTETIIGYKDTSTDPVFLRVEEITNNGQTLTLKGIPHNVPGVMNGDPIGSTPGTLNTNFTIKVPKIVRANQTGIFARLPKKNISIVDTSNSNLIISVQENTVSVDGDGKAELTSNTVLDASAGITSAFFEPFDAEKYSIHYSGGDVEPLTSDQVTLSNGNTKIEFSGLTPNATNVTINATLKKVGIKSKVKSFVRSEQLEVTRTSGLSITGGLTQDNRYGLRVEDEEISLNVPDVVNIVAIYESKTTSKASLDKLTFINGLNLNTNAIIGEQLIGQESRAVGQIVSRTTNEIEFVYLNANKFVIGEQIKFKESNIQTNLQNITTGNYVNRTTNYTLNKNHKLQFCDISKIVRKDNSPIPGKKLLIIYNKYTVPSSDTGDVFTVNSYSADRFEKDIPSVEFDRASDLLDFRPIVSDYDPASATGSPFAFSNRSFKHTKPFIITPNESSILGFSHYLPRIDKLVINQFEEVKLIKGESSEDPSAPTELGPSMEIAEIVLPPYLYDVDSQPSIKMKDNRRFTMRDIGALEKRIINLETVTTLNALELDTKSFQVRDADGLDRFKSGFAVNNFKNRDFINFNTDGGSRCDIDVFHRELISAVDFWSMRAELAVNPAIDVNAADLNSNLQLLDPNCKKSGDLITLNYTEVDWLDQPHATTKENVNPFEVIAFAGQVIIDPPSDNWARTIYIDNVRTESTGNRWVEQANIVSQTTTTDTDVDVTRRDRGYDEEIITTTTTTNTTRTETSFTNVLEGSAREYDYIEDVKISGKADPYMRSRNVYFAANGLKATTRHYHYLDNGTPDIVPKLIQISMSTGAFIIYENARIEQNGVQIGYVKLQAPNHKFGDTNRPDVGAGLGSPSVYVEKYEIDIFDRSRPAPSDTYSATSQLLNIDVSSLANLENYFGYIVKGARIIGETSGAVATVTSIDLFSDNWGDLIGAFFFRNANTEPLPPVVFKSGTKTFRVTAAAEGVIPLPGETALASDASGTFTGTGTILTQNTSTVQVRNPPAPPQRQNEITFNVTQRTDVDRQRIPAPHRDPLAQSFTVDETGAFLTSFDVFFASKDPKAKLFVELRHVELGTPTRFLVAEFAQVALNPNQINVSDDASVATTITFPSPIYLEPEKEYALIFLAPASDKYEMWCATMGEKTIRTSNLPDVENVVVSKQYIGGSLFKSQNGTIWTASQYQDLCFKLRKASFVSSGTATFFNSSIEPGNLNTSLLPVNALRSLPRKLKVKIDGSGNRTNNEFPIGRKVSTNSGQASDDDNITGIIEGQGAPIDTNGSTGFEIVTGGSGYAFGSTGNIPLISLTGSGTGSECTVTVSNGVITGISNLTVGSGYQKGEVLTIDNSNVNVDKGQGFKLVVTAINTRFDTLFLTDVQGKRFVDNQQVVEYGSNNNTRNAVPNVFVNTDSTPISIDGVEFDGKTIEITQFNHAHHSGVNRVKLQNVQPDTTITQITQTISADATVVSVADTTSFASYNGITTHKGEALLGSEIVSYVIGEGQLTIGRSKFGSLASPHDSGTDIQVYEASGISLVGINTTFTISANPNTIDSYFVTVDVESFTDPVREGVQQICFTGEKAFGGENIQISQNHQFSTFKPQFNCITPGKTTRVNSSVRTVSGTSAGGNEVPFIDQGFEPTTLNGTTFFPSPRLVASKINEDVHLTELPKNKSLSLAVDMNSDDPNLSPVLDIKNATFILGRNKINDPIGKDNYATDARSAQIKNDPHGSVFVSDPVFLEQPATSLKVLVGASVQPDADFRVYYRLFSADSSEVSTTYRAFPGFKNLKDIDGDGYGDDIIDVGLNDGRADAPVKPNRINEFSEYQFTVDNLPEFNGFSVKIVMSSTNESTPVKLKDYRAIALA